MRAFVNIYIERIKNIITAFHERRFSGKVIIEIDFKSGGICDAHCSSKEKIELTAAK